MTLTIREIQQAAARVTGIGINDILGPSRDQAITRARWIAMYAARLRTSSSFPKLGEAFNRDHTTVMHAIQEIDYRIWVRGEPELFDDIAAVCRNKFNIDPMLRKLGDWRRG